MILLIDTITYNCFSDYINDENTAKIPKNMKIKELSQLLTDKKIRYGYIQQQCLNY